MDSQDSQNKQMCRIKNIKEPFQPFCLSAFAVIHTQKWIDKNDAKTNDTIRLVYKDKRNYRVNHDPFHHGNRLFWQVTSIFINLKYCKDCYTTPVCRKSAPDQHKNNSGFQFVVQLLGFQIVKPHNHYCDKKRIHHACLIEYARLERDDTDSKCKTICEMRDDRKQSQSEHVFSDIFGIMISFCYKEPHNWCC